jgi:uncharacterized RDD family membrane protein YckC
MSASPVIDLGNTNTQPSAAALGSRGLRVVATLLDALMILFPACVIGALSQSYTVGVIVYLLAALLYAPVLLARPGKDNGQTIGKETLGLRVVSLNESQITPKTAILREFVGRTLLNVFTLGLFGFIDILWCLFDPRKQTLHDKIADTIVVKADALPTLPVEPAEAAVAEVSGR